MSTTTPATTSETFASASIEWCNGKTQAGNGVKVNWKELVEWFESSPAYDGELLAAMMDRPLMIKLFRPDL